MSIREDSITEAPGQQVCTVPGVGQVCLGALLPKAPPMCLRFGAYFDAAEMTAPPPDTLDYMTKAMPSIRRMYLNNVQGCCVISSAHHLMGIWSGNDTDSGGVVQATDAEIQAQYNLLKAGPGDSGCVITDVLDYTKSHGLAAGGKLYKIDGYVSVDWTDKLQVQVATMLFGGLKHGIKLPQGWVNTPDGGTWGVANAGRVVGGHDVPSGGFTPQGPKIATWGGTRIIEWAAYLSRNWLVEAYASLAPLWYNADGLAPCGLSLAAVADLRSDLARLGGGVTPPLPDPTPVPTPAPTVTFTATPTLIQLGGNSLLEWRTVGADSVTINGDTATLSGSNVASPSQDKTWELIAKGPGGVTVAHATVTVQGAPPPPPPPTVITVRRNQQVQIAWD